MKPWWVALLAALMLIPGLVFFWLRVTTPSDAAVPVIDFQNTQAGAVVVDPLVSDPLRLLPGDRVTAVEGRSVESYFDNVFASQNPTPSIDNIDYTVLRGERELTISVPLTVLPLGMLLKQNWSIYFYMVYLLAVSVLVFVLRPRLPTAQVFLLVSSVTVSSAVAYFPGLLVNELTNRWVVLLYLWGAVGQYGLLLAGLVHFSLIFPKPLPVIVRKPFLLVLMYLGVWLPLLIYLAVRLPSASTTLGRMALVLQGTALMSVTYFPLLLWVTYVKYQVSDASQRRQVRWLLWGLAISLVPYLIFGVVPSLFALPQIIPLPLLGILWSCVPTAFAIAILRDRLFDIDVIIRRTLIYTALTLTLGGIYFVSVLLFQRIFQAFVNQQQPPLATVLSTLVIAALFNPLHKRIQKDIDRRFYRRKYDTEKLLNTFALTVRNEVELTKLTERLLDVVDEAMEPQSLSIWIHKT